jgi:hypothetical protein
MTDIAIKKQISEQMEALERTTRNAIKSKESANQYLKDLGLIQDKEKKQQVIKKGK